jgi:alpha-tubulin suppressor-like RCC1 family protein
MEGGRTVVLAMTMALLLAVASPAMAGCQAKGAATTQEERTTKRGATNPSASSTDSPEVVTTLRAWGDNFDGQLGGGTYDNNRTRPVEVGGLRGAKVEALAGGASHTLALKGDGTVSAWGYNRDGELGNGTNEDSPTPGLVKDFRDPSGRLSGVRAVAAGSSHSLALKEDGTVRAWGYNQYGQLGNGSATNATETKCENTAERGDPQVVSSCADSPTPVRVGGLDGVEAIAAGASHALALKEDGTVWAWGANDLGQLGNGTKALGTNTLGINTPLKVKDLSGVKLVAAGLDYSLAGSQ